MATSWYRPGVRPKLLQAFKETSSSFGLVVELWDTTCIVTNFREAKCTTLINPGNPSLSGVSKFPYFPVGGPEPKVPPMKDAHHVMGFVSQWGGMDVGSGMMFSSNVVDGLVHQLGGKELASELKSQLNGKERINEGQAVWTNGVGDYEYLLHTVPPFYSEDDDAGANHLLQRCYQESLVLATANQDIRRSDIRIALPLLGAGCRGFPLDEAIFHCVESLSDLNAIPGISYAGDNTKGVTMAFGIPTQDVRLKMIDAFDTRTDFTAV